MNRIRRVVFWMHLAVGLSASVVILIMSATGALLAFEPQILARIERDVRAVELPAGRAPALPLAMLVARASAAHDGPVATGVTLAADPQAAVLVAFGSAGSVYVDPYSGRVLGEPSAAARDTFRAITNWHRWLGASAERREPARAITGASNLGFLLLAVSGLYLWWPRGATRARIATALRRNPGTSGRTGDFNRHTLVGFWCAPILIGITATGLVMSYSWANDLVYRVTGSPTPERRTGPAGRGSGSGSAQSGVDGRGGQANTWTVGADTIAWDRLVAVAASRMPTWSTMAIRADGGPDASLTLTDGTHWNAFARSTLTLDKATGEVVRWAPYAAQSAGQKLRGWIRFGHTGELGGLIGQTVACLACLGSVVLVWTAVSLALRRFAAWRRASAPRAERRAA